MKKRILVVDDDPTSLKTVESMLVAGGYTVKALSQANDIVQHVQEFTPHLIVLDLIMPNVDGNQAVKKIKRDPMTSGVPVIFLTALKMRDDDRGLDLEISVDGISYPTLTKPVDVKILLAEIERLAK